MITILTAMSSENTDAFRRLCEAMNRGDLDGALRESAADVVFVPARSALQGEYRGHEGLRKFWADNDENFDLFRVDFDDVRDRGDRVVALGSIHVRARAGGVETDIPFAGVASFRAGKLASWRDYRDPRLALEAAGLE